MFGDVLFGIRFNRVFALCLNNLQYCLKLYVGCWTLGWTNFSSGLHWAGACAASAVVEGGVRQSCLVVVGRSAFGAGRSRDDVGLYVA